MKLSLVLLINKRVYLEINYTEPKNKISYEKLSKINNIKINNI